MSIKWLLFGSFDVKIATAVPKYFIMTRNIKDRFPKNTEVYYTVKKDSSNPKQLIMSEDKNN